MTTHDTEMVRILMKRDGLTRAEAHKALLEARRAAYDGDDPSDVLEYFGLEPDYVEDLLV